MKPLSLIVLAAAAASFAGCTSSKDTVSFGVDGMACSNCAKDIAHHLEEVPGVRSASVNFNSKTATVQLDPKNPASMGMLQSAVDAWKVEHFGKPEDPDCLDPAAREKLLKK